MRKAKWMSATYLICGTSLLFLTCGQSEIKPVDIYPEDNCANCRMAVSDKSFASEIITDQREVFKFDDLGCLEEYRHKNPTLKINAIFVADYETKDWLPYARSVIVRTGIVTPMGSGKVAVADSQRAKILVERFPAPKDVS
ncbi:MAG: nitrous oxide reductase accessory protein NosL [Bacteroidota bacterium]